MKAPDIWAVVAWIAIVLLICYYFFASRVEAEEGSTHHAVYLSNYDGDTFRASIYLGLDVWLADQTIRVLAVDTPEIRGRCDQEKVLAILARDRLADLLRPQPFLVTITGKDSFGRWLAHVYASGASVAETLIAEGHAKPWLGRQADWCLQAR